MHVANLATPVDRPRPQGARSHRVAAAIVYSAVLTLAILNPLLCLLHCAFTHQHAALTSEQQQFLCDLGRISPALLSEPFSAVWGGPRAVHQAFQPVEPALLIILIIVARLCLLSVRACTHIPLPDFPPPKPHYSIGFCC